ncbi:MAG: translation initiation factor IF-3 [Alphaproteobacteria bacterium]|nr:translation initiation factor IF-3 [Alphaproteobacteria bacterium]
MYNRNPKQSLSPRKNSSITVPRIQLIDHKGTNHGVIDTRVAYDMSREANLDLVEINPTSVPPTCKILDYGKWRFDQKKKATMSRKNQKKQDLHEIKFSPTIEKNDLDRKLNKAESFLIKGEKVKIVVEPYRGRGRDMIQKDRILELITGAVERLSNVGVSEKLPGMEGRKMSTVVAPLKSK